MIKKIFKTLLFGLLLIPCFSFAGLQEFDLGLVEEITANTNLGYTLELKNNANFLLNDTYKLVQFKGSGQYPRQITYFWDGSGMYLIVGRPYRNPADIKVQGFLQYVNIVQYSDINMSYGVSPGFTPIEDFISNPQYSNPDKLLLGGFEDFQNQSLCFVYSSLNQAVCFAYNDSIDCGSQPQFCTNGVNKYITNSLNFDTWDLSFLSSYATNSPFIGSSNNPSYEIGDNFYTNGQIVEGYEYLGLDIGYCYGGFPIDDIFEPNQTIDDFTGYEFGVGATVWDLYDLYSGAYSTPKQFFQQMLQAYMNGQINRFKTEPKALIMFVQQFVSGRDRGRLNVGFYDIWDYCNLKFDNVDLNAQYTGHNKTPINGLNQKKASDSNLGGFQFTGDNAFNIIVGTGGSGNISASEFFGNLTSRFQNGLGTVNTNYVGMIPTYILMFMFALIFIRLISH